MEQREKCNNKREQQNCPRHRAHVSQTLHTENIRKTNTIHNKLKTLVYPFPVRHET